MNNWIKTDYDLGWPYVQVVMSRYEPEAKRFIELLQEGPQKAAEFIQGVINTHWPKYRYGIIVHMSSIPGQSSFVFEYIHPDLPKIALYAVPYQWLLKGPIPEIVQIPADPEKWTMTPVGESNG